MANVSANSFSSSFLLKFTFCKNTFVPTFFNDKGNNSPASIKSPIVSFNSAKVKLSFFVSGSANKSFKTFIDFLLPKYISAGDHLLISPKYFVPPDLADCLFAEENNLDIVSIISLSPCLYIMLCQPGVLIFEKSVSMVDISFITFCAITKEEINQSLLLLRY